MKPLFLDWNLGLGDAIICNGLVRFLAAKEPCQKIVLPCWERNLPTVRHMFSDLANVHVVKAEGDVPNPPAREYEILRIGVNNPNWGRIAQWDEAFYRFGGVPFGAKWDMFHVPESDTERPSYGPIVLCHGDIGRGFEIDLARCASAPHAYVDFHPSWPLLTDWRNVILDACEIHVIDSAPMHLVELLPTTGKLFYHKYARSLGNRMHMDAVLRKDWTVLE